MSETDQLLDTYPNTFTDISSKTERKEHLSKLVEKLNALALKQEKERLSKHIDTILELIFDHHVNSVGQPMEYEELQQKMLEILMKDYPKYKTL